MESNFEKKESYTDEQVDALMSYYEESDKRYKDPTPEEEKALGRLVIEILNETELPQRFEVTDITSSANKSVSKKAEMLFGITQIHSDLIPAFMINDGENPEYVIKNFLDSEKEKILGRAPWVNLIHAWMKVLNEMNTISAMQRDGNDFNPEVIASIAQSLYRFTTNSDGDRYTRTDNQFNNKEKFVETIKRESGTEGVNASRHVCLEEMIYILKTLKQGFGKQNDTYN